ncbi:MAG: DNA polymerase III subunit delta' [Proteobacteria bacterium]|nr:DNA polymerase III subunit delta' [Pseudomonadota bacterium]MBU1738806.1 DNA polymerase III subunit delta' [Pseudomonadota bacterium]
MAEIANANLTISSVLGQEKAKKMLRRAVTGNRLSHAYLFRGPAGVGKRTLGRAFARYLNCLSPTDTQDACCSCASCHKFASGSHPDLMVIEPVGVSIKIEQIRELKHALSFPPYEAGVRVVILTEVHTMRREAANSLLKILEEPPPGNLLILTGNEAGDILPTISSRCQAVPFVGLSTGLIEETLVADGIDRDTARTLAAMTGNSLGQARLLAGQGLLEIRRTLIEKLLATSPGKPETAESVFALAETTSSHKEDLPEILELIRSWLRDLILLSCRVEGRIINHDLSSLLEQAGGRWDYNDLLIRLDLIDKARRQLARNCNRTLVCEALYFGLL